MKIRTPLPSMLAATLPLLIAAGCAGNSQKLTQVDAEMAGDAQRAYLQASPDEAVLQQRQSPVDEAVATALTNMDGDVAELEEGLLVEHAVETSADEHQEQMPDEALLVAEVLGMTVDVITEAYESEAKTILPPPRKMVFHFESGKNNLEASDHEMIKAHAEYLLQHPNYVLIVTGHTDNQGSTPFNQQLSELRAQNVAALLMAEGIDESQLRVAGMGDAVPMVSPNNRDENRRVEFVYQDSMMATN